MPGCYVYLDMQYEDALPALNAMTDNALRLMVIGIAAFILVCAVTFYLMQNRMREVIAGARRIGLRHKTIWKQTVVVFSALSIVATVLGSLLAVTAFGPVTKALLKAAISTQIQPTLLCSGVELLFLMAASILFCLAISNPNLMQSGRKHKER